MKDVGEEDDCLEEVRVWDSGLEVIPGWVGAGVRQSSILSYLILSYLI